MRNHLDNTVSMGSVPQVMVDGFLRDRDQLALQNSTLNPHFKQNSLLYELWDTAENAKFRIESSSSSMMRKGWYVFPSTASVHP